MYYVYILYSKIKNRYYIGQTNNSDKRLSRHNKGEVRSTRYGIPWVKVYEEEYESRSEAMKRERNIKMHEKSKENRRAYWFAGLKIPDVSGFDSWRYHKRDSKLDLFFYANIITM